jgi:hypothetical protein
LVGYFYYIGAGTISSSGETPSEFWSEGLFGEFGRRNLSNLLTPQQKAKEDEVGINTQRCQRYQVDQEEHADVQLLNLLALERSSEKDEEEEHTSIP